MNERIDISKYKGVLIEYKCSKCHQIPKMFFESFQSQIARIKSDSCSHMSFKFISRFEGKNFIFTVSLNCLNCGENKIKILFDKDSGFSSNIEYKCEKCGNGDLKFGILLSEEIIDMDENNNDENQNEFQNKMNQYENNNNNNNYNNNNMNQNLNNNNNNIIYNNNYISGNNYDQGFGVNLAVGNNMNNSINNDVNNKIFNNNMNNNILFNNMIFNNNQIMNNRIGNCNINTDMVFNIMKNNNGIMNINNNMINQPIINGNNNIKFFLNFCDMTGKKYQIESSPDAPFAEVIRNLLNKYPEIDREKIASFVSNGIRVKNQKTIKENGISNGDKIMIHFKNN